MFDLNIVEPETRILAPASIRVFAFSVSIPPSTNFNFSITYKFFSFFYFAYLTSINFCPPKPGSTVIIKIKSMCSKYFDKTFAGVDGLIEIPIFFFFSLQNQYIQKHFQRFHDGL